jgi:hypothetical protein
VNNNCSFRPYLYSLQLSGNIVHSAADRFINETPTVKVLEISSGIVEILNRS